jgi:hypothetical protein
MVDRQILPFANMSSMWYRKDVQFDRLNVRMKTERVELPGKPIFGSNIPPVKGFEELDETSYMASSASDGIIGFAGKQYTERKGLSPSEVLDVLSVTRFLTFTEAACSNNSFNLWPSFFVKMKRDSNVPGLVEMYDVESEKWEWVVELETVTPITWGCPHVLPLRR